MSIKQRRNNMCSSPSGSSKSTVNKPRSGGLFAEMSPSARRSFAQKANAADDRKTERLERQKLRLMNESKSCKQNTQTKNSSNQSIFSSIVRYFY